MQEVRSPGAYMDIMGAISAGRRTISEIADYTKIPRENLPKYIASLVTMRLMTREVTQPRGKVNYTLADPFLHFWFRFVWANRNLLEAGLNQAVWDEVDRELGEHLGRVFEGVALGHITRLIRGGKLRLNPDYVGRWVDRDIRNRHRGHSQTRRARVRVRSKVEATYAEGSPKHTRQPREQGARHKSEKEGVRPYGEKRRAQGAARRRGLPSVHAGRHLQLEANTLNPRTGVITAIFD